MKTGTENIHFCKNVELEENIWDIYNRKKKIQVY